MQSGGPGHPRPAQSTAQAPGPGPGGRRAICFLSGGQSGASLHVTQGPDSQVGCSANQPAALRCRNREMTAAAPPRGLPVADVHCLSVPYETHGARRPSLPEGSRLASCRSRVATRPQVPRGTAPHVCPHASPLAPQSFITVASHCPVHKHGSLGPQHWDPAKQLMAHPCDRVHHTGTLYGASTRTGARKSV